MAQKPPFPILPSLADGDAALQPVAVAPGDPIVDAADNATTLAPGVVYRPSGCQSADCAVEYADGAGPVMLDQLAVTFRLLPGLQWSDGAPLTSADSVFNFGLSPDPGTPVRWGADLYPFTESYVALDELTLRWTGRPATWTGPIS